jgi:hypothetical protein
VVSLHGLITDLNWFLFNHNSSLVFLTEEPKIRSFTCLSPDTNFQHSRQLLLLHSLEVPLTALPGIPQAGSGPTNGVSESLFAHESAISLPSTPICPCTLLYAVMFCQYCMGRSQMLSAQLDCLIECKCFCCYSSYLYSTKKHAWNTVVYCRRIKSSSSSFPNCMSCVYEVLGIILLQAYQYT